MVFGDGTGYREGVWSVGSVNEVVGVRPDNLGAAVVKVHDIDVAYGSLFPYFGSFDHPADAT